MEYYRAIPPMNMAGNLPENWKEWRRRFENYLIASELKKKDEDVQCAQLLQLMGDEALTICNTFTIEEADKDKIKPLMEQFEAHFVPKKSVHFERYKFLTYRQTTEATEQFIINVKNQAKQCALGGLEEDLIKTMITIGIKNPKIREHLLQNEELTLAKAIELCKSSESAVERSKVINNENSINVEAVFKGAKPKVKQWKISESKPHPSNTTATPAETSNQFQPRTSESRSSRAVASRNHRQGYIKDCSKCGCNHQINNCLAYGKKCKLCKKLNHFAVKCRTKHVNLIRKEVNTNDDISVYTDSDSSEINYVHIDTINDISEIKSWNVDLLINNEIIKFKLDTGSTANLINEQQFNMIVKNRKVLHKVTNSDKLISYTGNVLPLLGKCALECFYKDKIFKLHFYVVQGLQHRAILGLESCIELNIIQKINLVESELELKKLVQANNDLFKGIGKISKPYHIPIDHNVPPKIHAVRKIPFALENQFKQCLNKLEENGIIAKVEGPSEWVNALVLVRKPDGTLRICLDPKDLNKAIKREHFKIPVIDEIISNLNGAKYFSTLDASSGFWNIPLDKESSNLCTFGTPYGRYKFLRMPYGITSASEVFQQRMKEIFNDEGMEIYIDDILIWGRTPQEHNARLKKAFEMARQHNIKFQKSKCKFGLREVKYLGHTFSENGISVDEEKVEAIKDMPRPTNKNDVQRFLGFVTYVSRFIKNMSEKTKPLRDLIKHNVIFQWNAEQERAFEEIKEAILNSPELKYFDANKEVTISVDSSQAGIGAVLLQEGKPCAFGSRAMTQTQINYAQIEKELLAICFGVQKFHQYVFGRKFTVETDHKPLISIFNKSLNETPARLQRMLLSLQKYDFNITYKPGKNLILADSLSRANINKPYDDNLALEAQICLVTQNLMITDNRLTELIDLTKNDPELQLIKQHIKYGWPQFNKLTPEMKKYYKFKNEITEANDLLLKNNKIIIPKQMRNLMLEKIHAAHFGINKCIQRANINMYWPGMCSDIEQLINKCRTCQEHEKSNPREPLIPHHIPKIPWLKIAIDIYEISNSKFLLAIDYYSKFVEIENLNNDLTSKQVINKLKAIFARQGIPAEVISDGGPQFSSKEFQDFTKQWNFTHKLVSPHHQQANGMAERAIQTVKRTIKKCMQNGEDIELALLIYRNTPINGTYTPAQILNSRTLRDNIPTLQYKLVPKIIDRQKFHSQLDNSQKLYKKYYDKNSKQLPPLQSGQKVKYQDRPGGKWKFGVISDQLHDRSYKIIKEGDDRYIIRNRKHIKLTDVEVNVKDESSYSYVFDKELLDQLHNKNVSNKNTNVTVPVNSNILVNNNETSSTTRSGRNVKPPIKLDL